MAEEPHNARRKSSLPRSGTGDTDARGPPGTVPASPSVFRRHAPALILFFVSLFCILAITNPAIYMNDEWITANQLHQLNIGHQVTLNEGKYGVTQNGTMSAYFTSRQNILMYSLALPVAALPVAKLFGIFGDNFRLLIILVWSLCLVAAALLTDVFVPSCSRVRGMRLLFPAMLAALLLFLCNILLYKQFPFSAPDAPYEVAAIVFANEIFCALIAAFAFEIFSLLTKNAWRSLLGTAACISCSSYLFWAGAAKDHILTTLLFAIVLYCFLRFLLERSRGYAVFSFFFAGLLIWVRPEVGFFTALCAGLFLCIPPAATLYRGEVLPRDIFTAILPAAAILAGAIPFFLNNYLINHAWLVPLPRVAAGSTIAGPLPVSQIITDPSLVNLSAGTGAAAADSSIPGLLMQAFFGGFTIENLGPGLLGMMTFPKNQSIGFLVMCPVIVVALLALLFWKDRVISGLMQKKTAILFLTAETIAVFFSYLTQFGSMNTSLGVIPDMRYLTPAYLSCGILAMLILFRTPVLKRPDGDIRRFLRVFGYAAVLLIPVYFAIMFFMQPFGNDYRGFATFFRLSTMVMLVLCLGAMIAARSWSQNTALMDRVPYLLVLLFVTVLAHQLMLTSVYGILVKVNGYPFWIPLVREGVGLFIQVQYAAPI